MQRIHHVLRAAAKNLFVLPGVGVSSAALLSDSSLYLRNWPRRAINFNYIYNAACVTSVSTMNNGEYLCHSRSN